MPVLRSQRSKPSKRREEEEMPPPSAATPPRNTRSTRGKKPSKREEVDVSDEPKSPTPSATSTSSTQSTRTRTRSKAVPVQEIAEPSPPSARSTRSTKQKATSSLASKESGTRGPEKKTRSAAAASMDPVVELSPPLAVGSTKEQSTAKTASKRGKGKGRTRNAKRHVESTSDDFSEESDVERGEKKLTLEQLHKQHVVPLKTALEMGMCEVYSKCMTRLMDKTAAEKQEREFQRLMAMGTTEMGPPIAPAPKAKGKGRQKRARSPEKTPTKATTVPESFNFADNNSESHVPAAKKMIMDQPTPDRSEASDTTNEMATSEEIKSSVNAPAVVAPKKKVDSKVLSKAAETAVEDKAESTAGTGKEQKKPSSTAAKLEMPKKLAKEKDPEDLKTRKFENGEVDIPTAEGSDASDKKKKAPKGDKKPKKGKKVKSKLEDNENPSDEVTPVSSLESTEEGPNKVEKMDETDKKVVANAIASVLTVETNKEEENKNVQNDNDEADIFEQSTMAVDLADESVMVLEEVVRTKTTLASDNDKKQLTEIGNKEATGKPAAVAPEKKSVLMDETYLCETPKDKEPKFNTTFTPELFTDTPKSHTAAAANETIVISKHVDDNKGKPENQVLSPPSPDSESESIGSSKVASSSTTGKVSSLVNFFDKNKKEIDTKNGNINRSSSKTTNDEVDKTRSISPDHHDSVDKTSAPCNELNSTYVLPPAKKANTSSAMNVTVCVKKASTPEMDDLSKQETQLKPILPSPGFLQQTNSSRFMLDSPASRTFVKEAPCLAVVVEEEDDGRESVKSDNTKQSEKTRPAVSAKPAPKDKDKNKEKGTSSSSSSSSCSSMKSASSQPCLLSSKKLPTSASKNLISYGSTGKLNEIHKQKTEEAARQKAEEAKLKAEEAAKQKAEEVKQKEREAERRRQELLQQKVESTKKKNAERLQKAEKNKLEEERRLKEKQKVIGLPPSCSASSILKKPTPLVFGKTAAEGGTGGLGFSKPKFNFGPSAKMTGPSSLMPPLTKNPFHKPAVPPPPIDVDMDDSFKSANNASGFLDQTTDGHLSSYDITVYEDLDEDLKHRENKTFPNWAADKEALKVALFSMVYLPEYQNRLPGGFPKADKSYKLFPTRSGHH